MGLFSKSAGYADVNDDVEYVRQYFSEGILWMSRV